jgi:hypothetical protein
MKSGLNLLISVKLDIGFLYKYGNDESDGLTTFHLKDIHYRFSLIRSPHLFDMYEIFVDILCIKVIFSLLLYYFENFMFVF